MTVLKLPMSEWDSDLVAGMRLTASDRQLGQELSGAAKLGVDELIDGVRFTARQWVGVVRLSKVEVSILPKFSSAQERLVGLVDFATGLDALQRNRGVRTLDTTGANLFDLIATLFLEEVQRLLRSGLRLDYLEKIERLPVLRGRLELSDQYRRAFGRIDLLTCRFDDQETDILENQLIHAALQLCATRVVHPGVRRNARELFAVFAEVCGPLAADLVSAKANIEYNRLNEHYRTAHELGWLIFEGLGVSDLLAGGRTDSFAFLLDMNVLFERFVYRLLVSWLARTDVHVQYQLSNPSVIREVAGGYYASIRPDIVISTSLGPGRVPIDAKYKPYDARRIGADDLSQAFLYAYAYSASAPFAMLVYPAQAKGPVVTRLEIRGSDRLAVAHVTAVGLDIPAALAEARLSQPGPHHLALMGIVNRALLVSNAA